MMRERQDRLAGEHLNGAAVSAQDGRREASDYRTQRAVASAGNWDSWDSWNERSRIVLSPVAAPSILGLFGFAGATFMAASLLADAFNGRTILPLGKYSAAANIPGRKAMQPIGYPGGMPGAKVGQ